LISTSSAAIPCNDTHNPCEDRLWKGSKCIDGVCSNPFQAGCINAILKPDVYKNSGNIDNHIILSQVEALYRRVQSTPRACNSEDSRDAIEEGLCVNSIGFEEVRIFSQNWESAVIASWIMQIIYSEMLGIPSTLETGMADKNLNFYERTSRLEYGGAMDNYEMYQNAYDAPGGDCTTYKTSNDNEAEDYISCAHATMEFWGFKSDYHKYVDIGVIEAIEFTGAVGYEAWFCKY
jgi:hypothetical protein